MEFELKSHSRIRVRVQFTRLRSVRFCAGILTFFLLLFGNSLAAQTPASQAEISARHVVTDEIGRRVQVPQEAARVVSLAPNLTEIVFALGDGNHLAGDTDYCDFPPEAAKKPHIGGILNPNLEEIAALQPDLVLATKSINRRETVDALDRFGLPVYVTDPHSIEGVIVSVEHLGSALGAEKSAVALVQNLRARLSGLEQRLAGTSPRRVLFVEWADPLISVGQDTFVADAMRRAGGRSVVDTAAEWPKVSLEEMVRLQPETLVFSAAHASDIQRDIDALRERPGWRDFDALRRGNIVVVSDAINRPAPRIVDAIEQLARALHPEAFAARAAPVSESNSIVAEACACAR